MNTPIKIDFSTNKTYKTKEEFIKEKGRQIFIVHNAMFIYFRFKDSLQKHEVNADNAVNFFKKELSDYYKDIFEQRSELEIEMEALKLVYTFFKRSYFN